MTYASSFPPKHSAPVQRLVYPFASKSKSVCAEELTSSLNRWSQEAEFTEGRAEANRRILLCYKNGDTKLDLSNLSLVSLPSCLVALKNLTHLNLSNNYLKTLPPALNRIELRHLEELNLSNNEIDALPENFWRNKLSLKKLNMANCKLRSLPDLQLKTLKSDIPGIDCIQGLELNDRPAIQSLNLQGNRLKTLPKNLNFFSYLQEIFVQNNQLQQLPDSIWNMPALNHLNIGHNSQLETLPALPKQNYRASKRPTSGVIAADAAFINSLSAELQFGMPFSLLSYRD